MASSVSIRVGALEARRDFGNDAEVAAVLGRCYKSIEGAPLESSNQQRLEFVLAHLVGEMERRAAAVHRHELRAAREAEDNATVVSGNTLK